jgi:hypothetical protein
VNEEVLAIARNKSLPPSRVQFLRADAYTPQNFPEFDARMQASGVVMPRRVSRFLAALRQFA